MTSALERASSIIWSRSNRSRSQDGAKMLTSHDQYLFVDMAKAVYILSRQVTSIQQ